MLKIVFYLTILSFSGCVITNGSNLAKVEFNAVSPSSICNGRGIKLIAVGLGNERYTEVVSSPIYLEQGHYSFHFTEQTLVKSKEGECKISDSFATHTPYWVPFIEASIIGGKNYKLVESTGSVYLEAL